jgi:hypothetical protein
MKKGSLAQLVEQRTFNPLVAGSIPARPTSKIKGLAEKRLTPFSLPLDVVLLFTSSIIIIACTGQIVVHPVWKKPSRFFNERSAHAASINR